MVVPVARTWALSVMILIAALSIVGYGLSLRSVYPPADRIPWSGNCDALVVYPADGNATPLLGTNGDEEFRLSGCYLNGTTAYLLFDVKKVPYEDCDGSCPQVLSVRFRRAGVKEVVVYLRGDVNRTVPVDIGSR